MKLNQKAQHLIEYMLLVAAVVAGVLGVTSPGGPMHNAVDRSLNRAVETIYGDYYWKLGVASPCSVLPGCGNGTQTRTVVCASGTGSIVDDGLCAGKGPKPLTTIDCNIACGGYGWWQSGFGPCSVACGPGTQSQVVECRDAGGVTVADALCGPGKPPESTACDNGCYAWVAGTTCTGLCSEPCGIGTCPRSVVCQDTRTALTVPDANCPGPKPGPTIACNTAITCGYQWVVDDWGNCDQGCGPGFKHRSVTCRRIADNALMPDANCGLPTKPVDQLACNLGPCNHWAVEGDWSTCTKPCGTGNQDANIVCKDKFEVTQPDANCPVAESGPKPDRNRPCNTGACTWGTSAYGACSTTCGSGTKTRDVWCYQFGFPLPHLDIAWCGGVPPAPGGAANCSNPPLNTICTQNDTCNDTSTCCGNGVCNNFPAIPYSEPCGTCSNDCGPCAGCTFPAGSSWTVGTSTCTADTLVSVAHAATGTANDTGAPTKGSISAKCNNGVWDPPSSQSCITEASCSFLAGSTWTVGTSTCSADVTVTVASGSSGTANDTGFPTTGSISASCSNGVWGAPTQSCVTAAFCGDTNCSGGETCVTCPGDCGACASCTFNAGQAWTVGPNTCNANVSVTVAHGASGTATDSVAPTTGSITAPCNNGVWGAPTAQSCNASAFCGDGSCNGAETCATCASDCGACAGCTFPVGSAWTVGPNTCNATSAVSVAHGASGTATDSVAPTTGSITAPCNNGVWGAPTAQSCTAGAFCGDGSCNGAETCSTCASDCGACAGCTFAAGTPWTVGPNTCNATSGVSVAHGASGTATDSVAPTTGSITAPCNNGVWGAPTAQSCNASAFCGDGSCNGAETCATCVSDCGACAGCTRVAGFAWTVGPNTCNATSGVSVAHGASGTATDSVTPTTGSITAPCNNGVWGAPTAQSCNVSTFCGDGSCNGTETCSTCASDCGACVTCTFAAGAAWTDSGTGLTCNNSGGAIVKSPGQSATATDSGNPTVGSITATCTAGGTWSVTAISCACGGGTQQLGAGCYPWCVCESCSANGWNCGRTNCGQSCGTCRRDWSCWDHRCECDLC